MKESRELPATARIRRGGVADVDFVRSVAVQVFSHFGDYGRILPTWLLHEGVLTHIAELGDRPVGYTMLGFYPVPKDAFVADLLAIAVTPEAQGRGVGRRLLEHVVAQTRAAQHRLPISELRLSVADSNEHARALFTSFGFTLLDGDHGYYDGGQLALHLALKL